MTTKTSLRAFLDVEAELSEHLFRKRGEVHLMFVGQDVEGARHPIQAITYSDRDKDAAVAEVREYFLANHIVRYAVHSEAWLLVIPKDTPIPATRPADHPDRIEALIVEVYDAAGNSLHAHRVITRVGGQAKLEPIEVTEGPAVGRFANLLMTTQ